MMNIVALCFVFTSLVTAGVWSPSPASAPKRAQGKQDVIRKEGHRTVEVEYGENDGNTKVTISSQEGQIHAAASNLKEKVSEPVENVKEAIEQRGSPRELVCDAFGKCKHKLASAVGKTKEVVSEKAHEMKEKVKEVEEEAKQTAGETVEKMKDAATRKAHEAMDETKEKLKRATKEATDVGTTLKKDVKGNVSKLEGRVEEVAETMKQKNLKGMVKKGGEIVVNVFGHVMSPESMASGFGITRLLALSVAYGICIWVTFISSYILAQAMPRQQFAILQSRIYPPYFKVMAVSVGVALISHTLSPKKGLFSSRAEMLQGFSLVASMAMILFNLKYMEPRATKIMFERMKLEKEEGRGMENPTTDPSVREIDTFVVQPAHRISGDRSTGQEPSAAEQTAAKEVGEAVRSDLGRLSQMLKKLNSFSSFLNILTMVALTWQLVHLGKIINHISAE